MSNADTSAGTAFMVNVSHKAAHRLPAVTMSNAVMAVGLAVGCAWAVFQLGTGTITIGDFSAATGSYFNY